MTSPVPENYIAKTLTMSVSSHINNQFFIFVIRVSYL